MPRGWLLARKILLDRDQPDAARKTLSVNDPEARRGKHGEFYDGYLTDILMDADSGIITQIKVLEAGGDEARDAVDLVRAEQAAHGNQIEGLSIDGAGFNGQMLRELEGAAAEDTATEAGIRTSASACEERRVCGCPTRASGSRAQTERTDEPPWWSADAVLGPSESPRSTTNDRIHGQHEAIPLPLGHTARRPDGNPR